MRTITCGALFIAATCLMNGCNLDAKPGASAGAQADKIAATKACVMQSGGINVLQLTTPANLRCIATDGSLHLNGPQYEVEFWLVPGAQTVDDAIPRVGPQIVTEFKDFKPNRTTDLTIAGSPAKRLLGSGVEADDGDPGQADVIVFKVGNHIFVACNHGEGLTAAGQQGMLMLAQTAKMP